jgi:hypothetical protein
VLLHRSKAWENSAATCRDGQKGAVSAHPAAAALRRYNDPAPCRRRFPQARKTSNRHRLMAVHHDESTTEG